MSNTNKSGSPDPAEQLTPTGEADQPGRRGVSWQIVVLALAALALALVIGTQVIGVLYAMAFPPVPPLPQNARQLTYTRTDYGVEEWIYGTDDDPCQVLDYFAQQGAECRVSAFWCGQETDIGSPAPAPSVVGQHIGRCVGETTFSVFAMRWDVVIAGGYQTDGQTHFRMAREIFWTGDVPPLPTPGAEF